MKSLLKNIHITNSLFLIGTFATTCTAVPLYLYHYGISAFQTLLFLFFFVSTGMSITLGYHRLFSHLTFQANPLVKLYTLLFGAAAFEGSALGWAADHRRHHKHVDHDDDPYDISKGLFHAHIGWLLFRRSLETPLTWVRDLQKDRLACLQHQYYVPLALTMGFVLPTVIGYVWGGGTAALGAFLLSGVARIVLVHHMTFCINSLCHWIGNRPYSSKCSARDSLFMAFFTFGEGYHNFHHEFQHDYRNGVKPWQFDPTKWTIWLLSKLGLVKNLRTVAEEKILKAQIAEHDRQLEKNLQLHDGMLTQTALTTLAATRKQIDEAILHWETLLKKYRASATQQHKITLHDMAQLQKEIQKAWEEVHKAIKAWKETWKDSPIANHI